MRASLTYPNGIQTSYGYDGAVRLNEILAQRQAGAVTRAAYTYDPGFGSALDRTTLRAWQYLALSTLPKDFF